MTSTIQIVYSDPAGKFSKSFYRPLAEESEYTLGNLIDSSRHRIELLEDTKVPDFDWAGRSVQVLVLPGGSALYQRFELATLGDRFPLPIAASIQNYIQNPPQGDHPRCLEAICASAISAARLGANFKKYGDDPVGDLASLKVADGTKAYYPLDDDCNPRKAWETRASYPVTDYWGNRFTTLNVAGPYFVPVEPNPFYPDYSNFLSDPFTPLAHTTYFQGTPACVAALDRITFDSGRNNPIVLRSFHSELTRPYNDYKPEDPEGNSKFLADVYSKIFQCHLRPDLDLQPSPAAEDLKQ